MKSPASSILKIIKNFLPRHTPQSSITSDGTPIRTPLKTRVTQTLPLMAVILLITTLIQCSTATRVSNLGVNEKDFSIDLIMQLYNPTDPDTLIMESEPILANKENNKDFIIPLCLNDHTLIPRVVINQPPNTPIENVILEEEVLVNIASDQSDVITRTTSGFFRQVYQLVRPEQFDFTYIFNVVISCTPALHINFADFTIPEDLPIKVAHNSLVIEPAAPTPPEITLDPCLTYIPTLTYFENDQEKSDVAITLSDTSQAVDISTAGIYKQIYTVTNAYHYSTTYAFNVETEICPPQLIVTLKDNNDVIIDLDNDQIPDHSLTLTHTQFPPTETPSLVVPACAPYNALLTYRENTIAQTVGFTLTQDTSLPAIDPNTPADYPQSFTISYENPTERNITFNFNITVVPCNPTLTLTLLDEYDLPVDRDDDEVPDYTLTLTTTLDTSTAALKLPVTPEKPDTATGPGPTLAIPSCQIYVPEFNYYENDIISHETTSISENLSAITPDIFTPENYLQTHHVTNAYGITSSYSFIITITSDNYLCGPKLKIVLNDLNQNPIDQNLLNENLLEKGAVDPNSDGYTAIPLSFIIFPSIPDSEITLPVCAPYQPTFSIIKNNLPVPDVDISDNTLSTLVDPMTSGRYSQSHTIVESDGRKSTYLFSVIVPKCSSALDFSLKDHLDTIIDHDNDNQSDFHYTVLPNIYSNASNDIALPTCAGYRPDFTYTENTVPIPTAVIGENTLSPVEAVPGAYSQNHVVTNHYGVVFTFTFQVIIANCYPQLKITLNHPEGTPLDLDQDSTPDYVFVISEDGTLTLPPCSTYHPSFAYIQNNEPIPTFSLAPNTADVIDLYTPATYRQDHIITNTEGIKVRFAFNVVVPTCTQILTLTLHNVDNVPIDLNSDGTSDYSYELPIQTITPIALPLCSPYNPVFSYLENSRPNTLATIGTNTQTPVIATQHKSYLQEHIVTNQFGRATSFNFDVEVERCSQELHIAFLTADGSSPLADVPSAMIQAGEPQTLVLPPCSPYNPSLAYYQNDTAVAAAVISTNLLPETIDANNPATTPQQYSVTDLYNQLYTFDFSITVQPCNPSIELVLLRDDSTEIPYEPILSFLSTTTDASLTLPACAPYNPKILYFENDLALSATSSENLAPIPVNPLLPATYTETRDLTNHSGIISRFTFSVIVQSCNEDLLITFRDTSATSIATASVLVTAPPAPATPITLVPCLGYNPAIVYRINEEVVATVTVGANTLADTVVNPDVPGTYSQQYAFTNPFNDARTADVEIIVPECENTLQLTFLSVTDQPLEGSSPLVITFNENPTIELPLCAPYNISLGYYEAATRIPSAVIGANLLAESVDANVPATVPQQHSVTNAYGQIYAFDFKITTQLCNPSIDIIFLTDDRTPIPYGSIGLLSANIKDRSVTLPACAPYNLKLLYFENDIELPATSSENLAPTPVNSLLSATYTETRDLTNSSGIVSRFTFGVIVQPCNEDLFITFRDASGASIDTASVPISSPPASAIDLTLIPCSGYNPSLVYRINGTVIASVTVGNNVLEPVIPTTPGTTPQRYTFTNPFKYSRTANFNVIAPVCNNVLQLTFLTIENQPLQNNSPSDIALGSDPTITLPRCAPYNTRLSYYENSAAINLVTISGNLAAQTIDPNNPTTTPQRHSVTNTFGQVFTFDFSITTQTCNPSIEVVLFTDDGEEIPYEPTLTFLSTATGASLTLPACAPYNPQFRYYEDGNLLPATASANLAASPVDPNTPASSYTELRDLTNSSGIISRFTYSVTVQPCSEDFLITFRDASGTSIDTAAIPFSSSAPNLTLIPCSGYNPNFAYRINGTVVASVVIGDNLLTPVVPTTPNTYPQRYTFSNPFKYSRTANFNVIAPVCNNVLRLTFLTAENQPLQNNPPSDIALGSDPTIPLPRCAPYNTRFSYHENSSAINLVAISGNLAAQTIDANNPATTPQKHSVTNTFGQVFTFDFKITTQSCSASLQVLLFTDDGEEISYEPSLSFSTTTADASLTLPACAPYNPQFRYYENSELLPATASANLAASPVDPNTPASSYAELRDLTNSSGIISRFTYSVTVQPCNEDFLITFRDASGASIDTASVPISSPPASAIDLTLIPCSGYNPNIVYRINSTVVASVVIGDNLLNPVIPTTPSTTPQRYTFTNPFNTSRTANFNVIAPVCTNVLRLTFLTAENQPLQNNPPSDIALGSDPTIALPRCAPYNTRLSYYENSAAINSATISGNLAAQSIDANNPATTPQQHSATNTFGQVFTFDFKITTQSCSASLQVLLFTDDGEEISYEPSLSFSTTTADASLTLPACAPYNPQFRYYENSELLPATASANLATSPVDPNTPASSYAELRDLTNSSGVISRFTYSVTVQPCNEDFLITFRDASGASIDTASVPISSPPASAIDLTLIPCSGYNPNIVYRINSTVVASVSIGNNLLNPVIPTTPSTTPQRYTFTNPFNVSRTANFNVIAPVCNNVLRLTFLTAENQPLQNNSPSDIALGSDLTIPLPRCAPYNARFSYYENSAAINSAAISGNLAAQTINANNPATTPQQHSATNTFGQVFTFDFKVTTQSCSASLQVLLFTDDGEEISYEPSLSFSTTTADASLTLPACAPYNPQFRYYENSELLPATASANLAASPVDPNTPASSYAELRDLTNSSGIISRFTYSVTVQPCNEDLFITFRDASGSSIDTASVPISSPPASAIDLTLIPCSGYNPDIVYRINGTVVASVSIGNNLLNSVIPTTPSTTPQRYTFTNPFNVSRTANFNIIAPVCTNVLRLTFLTAENQPLQNNPPSDIALGSDPTIPLPRCAPYNTRFSYYENSAAINSAAISGNLAAQTINANNPATTPQQHSVTNTFGQVFTFDFKVTTQSCSASLQVLLFTDDGEEISYEPSLSFSTTTADASLTLPACAPYNPQFRYYENSELLPATASANLAASPVDPNTPASSYAEIRDLTNSSGVVSRFTYGVTVQPCNEDFLITFRDASGSSIDTASVPISSPPASAIDLTLIPCSGYNPNIVYRINGTVVASVSIGNNLLNPVIPTTPSTTPQRYTFTNPFNVSRTANFNVIAPVCTNVLRLTFLTAENQPLQNNPPSDIALGSDPTIALPRCAPYNTRFSYYENSAAINSAAISGNLAAQTINANNPATTPQKHSATNTFGQVFTFNFSITTQSCSASLQVLLFTDDGEEISYEPSLSFSTTTADASLTLPACAPYNPQFRYYENSELLPATASANLAASPVDPNTPASSYAELRDLTNSSGVISSFTYSVTVQPCNEDFLITFRDASGSSIDTASVPISSPPASAIDLTLIPCSGYNPNIVYRINGTVVASVSVGNNLLNPVIPTTPSTTPQRYTFTNPFNVSRTANFNVIAPVCTSVLRLTFLTDENQPLQDVSPSDIALGSDPTIALPRCAPYNTRFSYYENSAAINLVAISGNLAAQTINANNPATTPQQHSATNTFGQVFTFNFKVTTQSCSASLQVLLFTDDGEEISYEPSLSLSTTTADASLTLPACAPYNPQFRYYENGGLLPATASANLATSPVDVNTPASSYAEIRDLTNSSGVVSRFTYGVTVQPCNEDLFVTFRDASGASIDTASVPISSPPASAIDLTLIPCSGYNPNIVYRINGTVVASVSIGNNLLNPVIPTTPSTTPQRYTFTNPFNTSRTANFNIIAPVCTNVLRLTFLTDKNQPLLGISPSDIALGSDPTIALPRCAPYNTRFSYYENSAAINLVAISGNLAAQTINANNPATTPQQHSATNTFGQVFTFDFSITTQSCKPSIEIIFLTDDGDKIPYTPKLSFRSTKEEAWVTLPTCAPYNFSFRYYEDGEPLSATASANLAASPVNALIPDAYIEIRDLTNSSGIISRFTFEVVVEPCNEDLFITFRDASGSSIDTASVPISSPPASAIDLTLIPCSGYNPNIVYRINGTVVASVSIGNNLLNPVIPTTPSTTPQRYTFTNPFNASRTANFNIIAPVCTNVLRLTFLTDENQPLQDVSPSDIAFGSDPTIALPRCAPYNTRFSYYENSAAINSATISGNLAAQTINANNPATTPQQHSATNTFGQVFTFDFSITTQSCSASLQVLLFTDDDKEISYNPILSLSTTTADASLTLPACAPYNPVFRYYENGGTLPVTTSANLVSSSVDPNTPASSYAEIRDITNSSGVVSRFTYGVTVQPCNEDLFVTFRDASGASIDTASVPISSPPASAIDLTLISCSGYNPNIVYRINGNTVASVAIGNNLLNPVIPTTPGTTPQRYTFTNPFNISRTANFNIIVPTCNAVLRITFHAVNNTPIPNTPSYDITTAETSTVTLPICAPYNPRFSFYENGASRTTDITISDNLSAGVVDAHTPATTTQKYTVANKFKQVSTFNVNISVQFCTASIKFFLLAHNDAVLNNLNAPTLTPANTATSIALPTCAPYRPAMPYYNAGATSQDVGATYSANLSGTPVNSNVAGTYNEIRDFTNGIGFVSQFRFSIVVTSCSEDFFIIFRDATGTALSTSSIPIDSAAAAPNITLIPCSGYSPLSGYRINEVVQNNVDVGTNVLSDSTVIPTTAGTYQQRYTFVDPFYVLRTVDFSITTQSCSASLQVLLFTDDDEEISYNPILSLSTTTADASLTLPACAPYNPVFRYYENGGILPVTTSANLASSSVDPNTPASSYAEIRDLTNSLGVVSRFTYGVTVQPCNEDLLLTFRDGSGTFMYSVSMPITSSPANEVLPGCSGYSPGIAYRINGTVIASVSIGNNLLDPVILTTPGIYPQRYTFTNSFNTSRTANFNIIVPTCNAVLRMTFHAVNNTPIPNTPSYDITTKETSTVTLPICAPYNPRFSFYEDGGNRTISSTISGNLSAGIVDAHTPATTPQKYTVTNFFGRVHTFNLNISVQFCTASIKFFLLAHNDAVLNNLNAPTLTPANTATSIALPTCAPYRPAMPYYNAGATSQDVGATYSANLSGTPVNSNVAGTYNEIRDFTNGIGFVSQFRFSIVVTSCSEDFFIIFRDATGTALSTSSIPIDSAAAAPNITLIPCSGYSPLSGYRINEVVQNNVDVGTSVLSDSTVIPTTAGTYQQRYTFVDPFYVLRTVNFNIIVPECSNALRLYFTGKDDLPIPGTGATDITVAQTPTLGLPACSLYTPALGYYENGVYLSNIAVSAELLGNTVDPYSIGTTGQRHAVTNAAGQVYTYNFNITTQACSSTIRVLLLAEDNSVLNNNDIQTVTAGSSGTSVDLPTCTPYRPALLYYEAGEQDTDARSGNNLAATAVNTNNAATYSEIRDITNNRGFVTRFGFNVEVSACSEEIYVFFNSAIGGPIGVIPFTIGTESSSITAITCAPYNVSMAYRLNGTIIQSVSVGANTLTSSTVRSDTVGTYAQRVEFTDTFNRERVVNFNVIIPSCNNYLQIYFTMKDDRIIRDTSPVNITVGQDITLTLPACSSYTPVLKYYENGLNSSHSAVGGELLGNTVDPYSIGTTAQRHAGTNARGNVYTYDFNITTQTCSPTIKVFLLAEDDSFLNSNNAPTIAAGTSNSVVSLPVCNPYRPALVYYEGGQQDAQATTSGNLVSTAVNTNISGTYSEIRDMTNSKDYVTRFEYSVVIAACLEELRISVDDDDGNSIGIHTVTITNDGGSSPDGFTVDQGGTINVVNVTLPACTPYFASVVYRLNGTNDSSIDVGENLSGLTVNTSAASSYPQEYRFTNPYNDDRIVRFNVVVPECNNELRIAFYRLGNFALPGTSAQTIRTNSIPTLTLPACSPYKPAHTYYENDISQSGYTASANLSGSTIDEDSPSGDTTTAQMINATNTLGFVAIFRYQIFVEPCDASTRIIIDGNNDETVYRNETLIPFTDTSTTVNMPVCETYSYYGTYYEEGVSALASISPNQAASEVVWNVGGTYQETRLFTNGVGYIAELNFSVVTQSCRKEFVVNVMDFNYKIAETLVIDLFQDTVPTLALSGCAIYVPNMYYQFNGTKISSVNPYENYIVGESTNRIAIAGTYPQRYRFTDHLGVSQIVDFKVTIPTCNNHISYIVEGKGTTSVSERLLSVNLYSDQNMVYVHHACYPYSYEAEYLEDGKSTEDSYVYQSSSVTFNPNVAGDYQQELLAMNRFGHETVFRFIARTSGC